LKRSWTWQHAATWMRINATWNQQACKHQQLILKILLCCIKQQIDNDDIEVTMNTQAVLNVYVDYLDDLSLYELENDVQLDSNASHKKTLLSSKSIFIFQSLKLTLLVFDVVLLNEAVDITTHN